MEAEESTTICQAHTPLEIQVEIDLGEANNRVHRNFTADEAVNVNIYMGSRHMFFSHQGN